MNNSQQEKKSLKEELVPTKEVNQQMSTEIQRAIEIKRDLQIEEAWNNQCLSLNTTWQCV